MYTIPDITIDDARGMLPTTVATNDALLARYGYDDPADGRLKAGDVVLVRWTDMSGDTHVRTAKVTDAGADHHMPGLDLLRASSDALIEALAWDDPVWDDPTAVETEPLDVFVCERIASLHLVSSPHDPVPYVNVPDGRPMLGTCCSDGAVLYADEGVEPEHCGEPYCHMMAHRGELGVCSVCGLPTCPSHLARTGTDRALVCATCRRHES